MNKHFLIVILLLTVGVAFGQKKPSLLHIISSDSTHGYKKNGIELTVLYKAVFQQDNTILSSDSAYLHQKENAFDAFGHVIITQGDTLHVFGDKLNYQGNTKIAIMTDNVRLIDKDAVLTTNYFTYNTATKFGTYTGGGKLVSKDNTLTSKNGYYFASSRDAYFRYDVVLNTPDAIIKTDTLRYNSGTRIAFFYGPTNIYGKKDKDTLYTENGTYNTQTEQAFFGKKNLYKQGTKSLKGDSLFYDRLIGYGKAVKHVTFSDTEQKILMKGGLGEYFKKEERTLMTIHPYVVFVTEEKDTTKTSQADSLKRDPVVLNGKSGIVKKPALSPPKNSMPIVDQSQINLAKDMANKTMATVPKATQDSIIDKVKMAIVKKPSLLLRKNAMPIIDSAKAKLNKAGKNVLVKGIPTLKSDSLLKKDTSHVKRDSIFMTADTIETQILVNKALKELKEQRRLAAIRDTSVKRIPSIVYTKPVKYIDIAPLRIRGDSNIFHKNYFVKVVKRDTSQHKALPVPPKKLLKPVVKKYVGIDSVNISQDVILSDTARIRILVAAHHAKIFKSDLQAKADSIFFSYGDSVARMYVHPIIWAQGSQLSADTINLQMKHKQLDNVDMSPNAMIVNIEKGDSTHFNQVGGKKMRGFFKDSKMQKMFVFGNAETIYFDRDSGKVIQMHHSISSKIRVRFKNNEPTDVMWYVKDEAKVIPIGKLKEEDKVMRNFIWKPKERPVSKESIINPPSPVKKIKDKVDSKKPPVKAGATSGAKLPDVKSSADSLKLKPDTLQHIQLKTDTSKTIRKHEPVKQ